MVRCKQTCLWLPSIFPEPSKGTTFFKVFAHINTFSGVCWQADRFTSLKAPVVNLVQGQLLQILHKSHQMSDHGGPNLIALGS